MKTREQGDKRGFKDMLKKKMDTYVHFVYKITKRFPHEERYGTTSQIRRAALSVALNYIEGYARKRPAVQLNFLEISYGSLKGSEYLITFAKEERYITAEEEQFGLFLADEIGAMVWTELNALEKSLGEKFKNTKSRNNESLRALMFL